MAPALSSVGAAPAFLPLLPKLFNALISGILPEGEGAKAAVASVLSRGGASSQMLVSRGKAACACLTRIVPPLLMHWVAPDAATSSLQGAGHTAVGRGAQPTGDVGGSIGKSDGGVLPCPKDVFQAAEQALATVISPLLGLSHPISLTPHGVSLLAPALSTCAAIFRAVGEVDPVRAAEMILGPAAAASSRDLEGFGHCDRLVPLLAVQKIPRSTSNSNVQASDVTSYIAIRPGMFAADARFSLSMSPFDSVAPTTLWPLRSSDNPRVVQAVAAFLIEMMKLPREVRRGRGQDRIHFQLESSQRNKITFIISFAVCILDVVRRLFCLHAHDICRGSQMKFPQILTACLPAGLSASDVRP